MLMNSAVIDFGTGVLLSKSPILHMFRPLPWQPATNNHAGRLATTKDIGGMSQ